MHIIKYGIKSHVIFLCFYMLFMFTKHDAKELEVRAVEARRKAP